MAGKIISSIEDPENEQDWTKSCPICFVEHVSLVRAGSCGHAFCVECLEQFFSIPSGTINQEETASATATDSTLSSALLFDIQDLKDHNIENIPTVGRCPLCRDPISALDMTYGATGQSVWSSSLTTNLTETPLAGKVYSTRRGIGYNSFHFPPFLNHSEGVDDEQDCDRNNLSQEPYFLWQEDDALYHHRSNDNQSPDGDNKSNDSDDDINQESTKYFFEPGCFYFAPKRVFHGRVSLPDSRGNAQPYTVLLSFAASHKWITGGFILQHYPPLLQEDDNNSNDLQKNYFPLEGKWKVTWYRERLPRDISLDNCNGLDPLVIATDYIVVVGNSIRDTSPLRYMLRYGENQIYFYWPGLGVKQTLEPECDFRRTSADDNQNFTADGRPNRFPAVGDYLQWTTTDPKQPYIVWKRETIGPLPPILSTSIEYFGRSGGDPRNGNNFDPLNAQLRSNQSWYREWHRNDSFGPTGLVATSSNNSNDGRPEYHGDRLWGNTFCQGLRVGLASYHFGLRGSAASQNTGEDENPSLDQYFAYISYENSMCSQWPPLDDGSPISPQVFFHDISVEEVEETRPAANFRDIEGENDNQTNEEQRNTVTTKHVIFRGNIEWLQDYGTTWQNNERWEYEMHFDSEFTCIVSGTVHCVTASTAPSSLPLRSEMSLYGTDLIYINAGILRAFAMWMSPNYAIDVGDPEDEITNIEADSYRRYTFLSRRLRRRLQAEGASVRTVAMLNMVLTMAQQPGVTAPIIDYNLS